MKKIISLLTVATDELRILDTNQNQTQTRRSECYYFYF